MRGFLILLLFPFLFPFQASADIFDEDILILEEILGEVIPRKKVCRCVCERLNPKGGRDVIWSEQSEYTNDLLCAVNNGESCEDAEGARKGMLTCRVTWISS